MKNTLIALLILGSGVAGICFADNTVGNAPNPPNANDVTANRASGNIDGRADQNSQTYPVENRTGNGYSNTTTTNE